MLLNPCLKILHLHRLIWLFCLVISLMTQFGCRASNSISTYTYSKGYPGKAQAPEDTAVLRFRKSIDYLPFGVSFGYVKSLSINGYTVDLKEEFHRLRILPGENTLTFVYVLPDEQRFVNDDKRINANYLEHETDLMTLSFNAEARYVYSLTTTDRTFVLSYSKDNWAWPQTWTIYVAMTDIQ